MTDEAPPLVASVEITKYGHCDVEFFDGNSVHFRVSVDNEADADKAASHPVFIEYLEYIWPWVKRCAEAGLRQTDLPPLPTIDLTDG